VLLLDLDYSWWIYRSSFDQTHNNNYNKNDGKNKTPKKYNNKGAIQFTIIVKTPSDESKKFTVFSKDSSLDAAEKLVKNFRLGVDLVPCFAAYIEEQRIKLSDA